MRGMTRLARFLLVVVVAKLRAAGEVDDPLLACRQFVPLIVADVDFAEERFADGAGMGKPIGAVHVTEAVALGAGIVFVKDGPPPFDHLSLDFDRAWRGGMDSRFHRADI